MNFDDEVGQAVAREIGETIAKKIAIGLALLFGFLFFIAFGAVIVRELWNWLMPEIFDRRRITLWEALGLLALSRILFGSFGMRGSHGQSDRERHTTVGDGGRRRSQYRAPSPSRRPALTLQARIRRSRWKPPSL